MIRFDSFDPFFSPMRGATGNRTSRSRHADVSRLPATDRPKNFSGAVANSNYPRRESHRIRLRRLTMKLTSWAAATLIESTCRKSWRALVGVCIRPPGNSR